ncbi:MAG TPA: OmpA family protein [Anaeromyxobacteraceae bacterium]
MRITIRIALLTAFGLALGIPAARAQVAPLPHVDLQRLTLDPAARGSLVVGDGEVAPTGEYRFGAALEYESQPLILRPGGSYTGNGLPVLSSSAAVVNDRFTLNLGVGYTIWERLELSVKLPVVGYQTVQGLQQVGIASPQAVGLGTPTLGLRYGLLRESDDEDGSIPLSLAIAADVLTPWGASSALAGSDSTAIATRLELGHRFGGIVVAAQGGALFRTKTIAISPEEPLGNELHAGLALASTGKLRVEVAARAIYDLSNDRKDLIETIGLRYAFGRYELFALGGPGLGHLAGTPTWLGMIGFAMGANTAERPVHVAAVLPAPAPAVAPAPLPEPPPPPPPAAVAIRPPDPCSPGEAHTPAQCPFLDDDADGIPNGLDSCPLVAGIKELQGCAPVDSDGDGIADHLDRCPKVAGVAEYDGCPAPKLAELKGPKIEIAEAIYFKWGDAAVQERSHGLLDDVVAVIKAHPEIKLVRVEGHSDNSGDAAVNRKLSRKRANAVRSYLVEKGIDPQRLVAKGFGPDRPVTTNLTAAGRRRNRRVDFFTTWRAVRPPEEGAVAGVKQRVR